MSNKYQFHYEVPKSKSYEIKPVAIIPNQEKQIELLIEMVNKQSEMIKHQFKMIEQQSELILITKKNSTTSTIIAVSSLLVAIASCVIPFLT